MIKEIKEDEFENVVLNEKGRILVDFYANWCGPCRMLRPILDSIAENGKKIVSVNIDENEELAMKYNVSSIPCLILFENGEETKRSVGLISHDEVEELIGE
jgi:thioredoxin 1